MGENDHIIRYLEDYLDPNHDLGFAVLLTGEWGCGKTWFVKNFMDHYKESKPKDREVEFIYISLYAVKSYEEIESQLFQKLFTVLSSWPVKLAGGIAKSILKDKLGCELPDEDIKKYALKPDKYILVFDDLERCKIPVEDVLGYINSYVEHNGFKIIIIGNESEINKEKEPYAKIKEKLIGKTFKVCSSIESALSLFVERIKNKKAKVFIANYQREILNVFYKADHGNLRSLKQSLWDFERFFDTIPLGYIEKKELMVELMSIFFTLSLEIKSGVISPEEIKEEAFLEASVRACMDNGPDYQPSIFEQILKKHNLLYSDFLLSEKAWSNLFHLGNLSTDEINENLKVCKYCKEENTQTWIKLWHYLDLEDDEFFQTLDEAISQWNNGIFCSPGEILHVSGLMLKLSNLGLYAKPIETIMIDCKSYIDILVSSGKLDLPSDILQYRLDPECGLSLGYAGKELKEFQEIRDYLTDMIEKHIRSALPVKAAELLNTMLSDPNQFLRMVSTDSSRDSLYSDIPIFAYIYPDEFYKKYIMLPNVDKTIINLVLRKRYETQYYVKALRDELPFLKEFYKIIVESPEYQKKTVSNSITNRCIIPVLTSAIKTLENEED